jgi:hypothetical protein
MSNVSVTKFVPHIDLYSGWTFVSIPDDNIVLGLKNVVLKTLRVCNKDGSQQVAPNGEKIYSMESQTIVKIFTNEEYQQMMKQSSVNI